MLKKNNLILYFRDLEQEDQAKWKSVKKGNNKDQSGNT